MRHCFASCFDHRVFVYKQQHGFNVLDPQIAVIVQQQVNSQVAGVAFSLNPLNNDYDEAVIDANWGLGESVVAGMAEPDHFVIDKTNGTSSNRNRRQTSCCLVGRRRAATTQRDNEQTGQCTLSAAQLAS